MAGLHREKMAESMQNTCRSCSGLEQHCSIIYNFTFDQDLCDFVNSSFNTKKKKALVSWKHLFDLTATEISPEIRINLDWPAKMRTFCMQSELLHTTNLQANTQLLSSKTEYKSRCSNLMFVIYKHLTQNKN